MCIRDSGQAVAHLSVQAHHDGLVVHQMSGFDPEVVREFADLEPRFTPTTVIALGMTGTAVTNGITFGPTATRTTWSALRTHLITQCGMTLP